MQYSIWIIPPEPIYSELKTIIGMLSKTYDGPIFEPHMTLLGNIDSDLLEIENNVRELVLNLDNLELTLGPISFSTTYFQSVFVRVNSSSGLMQLNLDAKRLFGSENGVFMPHISLLYGDHNMGLREEAASKVELGHSSFIVDKLIVTPAVADPSKWEHSFTASFNGNS